MSAVTLVALGSSTIAALMSCASIHFSSRARKSLEQAEANLKRAEQRDRSHIEFTIGADRIDPRVVELLRREHQQHVHTDGKRSGREIVQQAKDDFLRYQRESAEEASARKPAAAIPDGGETVGFIRDGQRTVSVTRDGYGGAYLCADGVGTRSAHLLRDELFEFAELLADLVDCDLRIRDNDGPI